MDIQREPRSKKKQYIAWGAGIAAIVIVSVGISQLKPAAAQQLCLAFDNPLFSTPRLRLATCGTSSRQQWAFESRSFANPVGYGHDDFIGSRVY